MRLAFTEASLLAHLFPKLDGYADGILLTTHRIKFLYPRRNTLCRHIFQLKHERLLAGILYNHKTEANLARLLVTLYQLFSYYQFSFANSDFQIFPLSIAGFVISARACLKLTYRRSKPLLRVGIYN
ncbi:MAG: hypothetical protein R2865_16410 [Deinococcales bacterium]